MAAWIDKLPRWLAWELAIPLTVLNIWLLTKGIQQFQTLLSIFVVATLLSFLLNYIVCVMENKGIARGYGVLAIVILVLGVGVLVAVTIVPVLFDQITDLTVQLPNWLESGSQQLEVLDKEIDKLETADSIDVTDLTNQFADLLPVELKLLPGQLVSFLMNFADKLLDVFITAVFTLYLVLYGDSFWQGLFKWIPNDLGQQVSDALSSQFEKYFFGQAIIVAIMSTTLAFIFFLLSVPFWLVFSLGIGLAVLIPFGDLLAIIAVSLFIGVSNPLLGGEVLIACIVIDQIVDNVFAPRILGDAVGLNPVWVLLSLFVGAQMGGLLGVVVAVPLAGTVKQIIDSLEVKDVQIESLKEVDLSVY